MEEFNISEILAYYRSKILYIILIIVIIITGGVIYSTMYKVPMYQSTSTIVLAAPESSSDTLQSDITLNQKLVETYKVIVKSRTVLEDVIKELELDLTYEELSNKISVSSVENTEILKITVEDENSSVATEIVTTTTDIFTDEVTSLYDIENIKVLDKASTPKDAYNINLIKDIVIYISIGLILSLAIFSVSYFFDKTLKTIEQVESIGDLTIIGTVPIARKKRGNIYE